MSVGTATRKDTGRATVGMEIITRPLADMLLTTNVKKSESKLFFSYMKANI